MAAFCATGAALRAFLRAATFLAALSCFFNAAFILGLVAAAIFALIEAILTLIGLTPGGGLLSFLVIFLTALVAFLRAALALTSLALMAAFLAGGAALRAFLREATFLAALSCFFNAATLSG